MGTVESTLTDEGYSETAVREYNSPPNKRQRPFHTVSTLQGVIVGLPSTGKNSLLQRLKGRDPFKKNKGIMNDDDPNSNKITVPYHAPGETFGEKLQLRVEISSSFEEKQQPDFYVVMINPRHDPKSLKSYLMKLLSMLMTTTDTKDNTNKTKVKSSVCILINFRDEQDKDVSQVRVSEKDIKIWIKDSKKERSSSVPSFKNFPIIETSVVSMRNCYGLLALHRFIYRSYLSRKQLLLEEELSQIRKELKKSQPMASKNQTYEQFLELLKKSSSDDEKIEDEVTKKNNGKDSTNEKFSRPLQPVAAPLSKARTAYGFPIKKTTNKALDIKQSLDDFFADTDVEDNNTTHTNISNNDDDDDDFYYNEDGKRMGTKVNQTASNWPSASGNKKTSRKKQPLLRGPGQKRTGSFVEGGETKNSNVVKRSIMGNSSTSSVTLTTAPIVKSSLELPDAKKVLNNKSTVVASDGWSDDDDLDISEEHNQEGSSSKLIESKEDEMKDGWVDDDDLSLDDDKLSKDILPKTNNDQEEYGWRDNLDVNNTGKKGISAKPIVTPPVDDGWGDDDELDLDDDGDENSGFSTTNHVKSSQEILNSDDDDDDDFMIGDTSNNFIDGGGSLLSKSNQLSSFNTAMTTTTNSQNNEKDNEKLSSTTTITEVTSSPQQEQGLSVAALSAIQAAQEQAQMMLGKQKNTQLDKHQVVMMNMQLFDKNMDSSSSQTGNNQKYKKKKKKRSSSRKEKKTKAT